MPMKKMPMAAKKAGPKSKMKAPALKGNSKGTKGSPAAKPMKGAFGKMMKSTGLDKSNI